MEKYIAQWKEKEKEKFKPRNRTHPKPSNYKVTS
jgi:hypothetical protein